jgi:hypothetical protein
MGTWQIPPAEDSIRKNSIEIQKVKPGFPGAGRAESGGARAAMGFKPNYSSIALRMNRKEM